MEYDTPSRFIRDIDPELLDIKSETGNSYNTANAFRNNRSRFESESPEWMQNPRPVATQFKADPRPRIVAPRQPEKPVDPFGPNFKRVHQAVAPRPLATVPSSSELREGARIEHQRFGIGTIIKIEGTGENTKATVEFKNTGTKQLLLKFAKFKIIG
jgi:DNA helicase-2/ATP-dependent DNA helicase PcrA